MKIVEAIWKNKWIGLSLILAATGCAVLWGYGPESLSDFGLNAFTETLGILVTVFFIDHLLKRQLERRLLPQRSAAYEDVRLYTARFTGFWSDAVRDASASPGPSTYEELFSRERFDELLKHLDLTGKPKVTPPRTWFDWFPHQYHELHELAERILERHNSILDPDAYALVHQLSIEGPSGSILTAIRQTDQINGIPRPTNLGSYWPHPEGMFDAILSLIDWAQREHKYLQSTGITRLKAPPKVPYQWKFEDAGGARLSSDRFIEQAQQFHTWQSRSQKVDLK